MRKMLWIPVAALAAACSAPQEAGLAVPEETVFLYAESTEGVNDTICARPVFARFEMTEDNQIVESETCDDYGGLTRISSEARFDLYRPAAPNGQMVIVCPGGGYGYVSAFNEGRYVAQYLTPQGITVAVLKYRLPNGHWTVPLADVQNTFRYCREHAPEWGVNQIGIMGFSAGGHLAATGSTLFTDEATRPDFSVLIYPVISLDRSITHQGTRNNLIGAHEELEEYYSLENQVSDRTPPTFLALCSDDDTVPPENSLLYYRQLIACGVPAEMHIYPAGGHGWGFTTLEVSGYDGIAPYREEFLNSLCRFLETARATR